MNFTEAMLHVSGNERSAVIRPDKRYFVWSDPDPCRAGGSPIGHCEESVDRMGEASRYKPSLEDILAIDWEVFELTL
jgi:hypothetical protein